MIFALENAKSVTESIPAFLGSIFSWVCDLASFRTSSNVLPNLSRGYVLMQPTALLPQQT